jgi:hypothetical protein
MEIPVFVSCPTTLSDKQAASRAIVIRLLRKYRLEPRDLGRSDYPTELPLREVLVIARHCAGGIILGFEQYRSMQGINKPGTPHQDFQESVTSFPTPWNQLEAGILFGLRLPLLIFRESDISGGIFDMGVTDVFIHPMPDDASDSHALNDVFLKWQASVRQKYYEGFAAHTRSLSAAPRRKCRDVSRAVCLSRRSGPRLTRPGPQRAGICHQVPPRGQLGISFCFHTGT